MSPSFASPCTGRASVKPSACRRSASGGWQNSGRSATSSSRAVSSQWSRCRWVTRSVSTPSTTCCGGHREVPQRVAARVRRVGHGFAGAGGIQLRIDQQRAARDLDPQRRGADQGQLHPRDCGLRGRRHDVPHGRRRRPSSRSRVGSTAANSPRRLAANTPRSRSACASGTPCATMPARYSSSLTATRVISRPVTSRRDRGDVREVERLGGGERRRQPVEARRSVRAIAAASARSAWAVQETGPSSGAISLPVCERLAHEHEAARGVEAVAQRGERHAGRVQPLLGRGVVDHGHERGGGADAHVAGVDDALGRRPRAPRRSRSVLAERVIAVRARRDDAAPATRPRRRGAGLRGRRSRPGGRGRRAR